MIDHIAEPLRALALPISSLVTDPANARLHPDRNLSAIEASLRVYGQRKPVVVRRDGMIVTAGNGTLEAAKRLGWTHLAAVVVDDDPVTATGFAIADNRTAELATWDNEALAALLDELKVAEVDVSALGWSDEDLAALLAEPGAPAEPPAEDPGASEPPAAPVSARGEVYALGPHRLMCGDATSAEDVGRVMAGEKPRLMVTDPPYGVEYDATWRGEAGHATLGKNRTGKVESDDRVDWTEAWRVSPADVVYCWHAGKFASAVQASLEAAGFDIRSQIVWNKTVMVMGRGDYHWKHEPCWYGVRRGATSGWAAGRDQTTVWDMASPLHIMSGSREERTPHPTQKPLEAAERQIRNHVGDVYDPFLGSGTTLIAAARQGRRCFGIEISPAYCDVIRRRWTAWALAAGQDPGSGALADSP